MVVTVRFASRIAAGVTGAWALPVGLISLDISARGVESGLPGAIIPGWQLSLMDAGAELRWPNLLGNFCRSARQFEKPYWTPDKADVGEATSALRVFLDARSAILDDAMLRAVASDAACDTAMDIWKSRHPVCELLRHDTPVHREWLEAWDACLAAVVQSRLGSYRAQYLGVSRNGHRAVYINGYCDPDLGGLVERLGLYDIVDGSTCYFHAYYNSETREIEEFWVNGEA